MDATRSPDHQRRCHSRATRQQREGGLVETRLGLVEDQRPPDRVAQDLQAVLIGVAGDTRLFHNSCAHRTQEYRCTTRGDFRPSKRVHPSPVSGMLLSSAPTRPVSCVNKVRHHMPWCRIVQIAPIIGIPCSSVTRPMGQSHHARAFAFIFSPNPLVNKPLSDREPNIRTHPQPVFLHLQFQGCLRVGEMQREGSHADSAECESGRRKQRSRSADA